MYIHSDPHLSADSHQYCKKNADIFINSSLFLLQHKRKPGFMIIFFSSVT